MSAPPTRRSREDGVASRGMPAVTATLGAAADVPGATAVVGATARRLLCRLGAGDLAPRVQVGGSVRGDALAPLCGHPDGPPLLPAAPIVAHAQGLLAAFEALSAAAGRRVRLDAATLLTERAAIAGLARGGRVSAGGRCRLLPACDGWLAVQLARDDDVELVPAWLERAVDGDPWAAVAEGVRRRAATDVAERARTLGIPVAVLPDPAAPPDPQAVARAAAGAADGVVCSVEGMRSGGGVRCGGGTHAGGARASRGRTAPFATPLVVDLSSLWAGPLCAHLLGLAGGRVIKVESGSRPDGARRGPARFYDLVHAGHESVCLDVDTAAGRAALAALVARADLVIEGSRPRALDAWGIGPNGYLRARPGGVWVSITGYGRAGPWCQHPAFGDDAAVAGGLVAWDHDGTPLFLGDAVADPLSGMTAAVAGLATLRCGGGMHVDVAMREVAAAVPLAGVRAAARPVGDGPGHVGAAVLPPPRRPAGVAPASGRDTATVLAEFGIDS